MTDFILRAIRNGVSVEFIPSTLALNEMRVIFRTSEHTREYRYSLPVHSDFLVDNLNEKLYRFICIQSPAWRSV